jgi:hypothetical protein
MGVNGGLSALVVAVEIKNGGTERMQRMERIQEQLHTALPIPQPIALPTS